MKTHLSLLFAVLLLGFSIRSIKAQVSSTYTFSNSTTTITTILGGSGTVTTNTGADDVQSGSIPIGFTFMYNGNSYTTFSYHSNGYIKLGTGITTGYAPLASFGNIISGMGGDLLGLSTNGSAMMYVTSGAAPNRVLTLEWKNWGFNNGGSTSADFDLQIKLFEASNLIQIIYNPLLSNTETTVSSPAGVVQVGLTGSTSADFNARTTNSNWAATIPASSVAPGVSAMTYSQTVRPAAGTVYTFTPGPPPCSTPPAAPTTLIFSGIGNTYATLNFSAASGADSYLVVRYPIGAIPTPPSDGVTYPGGSALGAGTVVGNPVSGPVALTGLTPATTYDVYVYSQNSFCSGGPLYLSSTGGTSFSTLLSTNFWLGVNPGADNWQDPANWTSGVPTATTDATIPSSSAVPNQPNISTAGVVKSLVLQNNAIVNVGTGATLNIKGDVASVIGSIKGLGIVHFSGSAAQQLSGSLTLNNVTFSNASVAGVTVATGASVRIEPTATNGSGIITFGNSAKFTNSGQFILGSNATATAKIGPIPTVAPNAATILGNMTVERYLPNQGSGNGSWYFMGSPVEGRNFTDFADDFSVTGLTGGFGDQGGNIISSAEPERSTIFEYIEASHNVHLDTVQKDGWRIPGNVNVVPGIGYRVWVKYQSNSSHKFDNTGPIAIGDNIDGSYQLPALDRNEYTPCFPSTPSYDPNVCNESNRGWNLLSNPFPCDIDWDSPIGWAKPSTMNNAFITWNSALNGYRVYVGTTGVSLGVAPSLLPNPNLIASGQGFFVKRTSLLKAGSTIALKESGKTTGTSAVFTRPSVVVVNQMTIGLTRLEDTDGYKFVSMFRIHEEASESFDNAYDAYGISGARPHIAFPMEGELLVLNSFGNVTVTTYVPMHFNNGGQTGAFKFSFANASSFENVVVYLKDNYLNTITETSAVPYTFTVDANQESYSANRFELLVNPVIALVTPNSSQLSGFSVYPNPFMEGKGTTFALKGFNAENASLIITDALGREVFKTIIQLGDQPLTEYHMKAELTAGIYSVKAAGGSKSFTLKLAVR